MRARRSFWRALGKLHGADALGRRGGALTATSPAAGRGCRPPLRSSAPPHGRRSDRRPRHPRSCGAGRPLRRVPRHEFVPEAVARGGRMRPPLHDWRGADISQPRTSSRLMTELAAVGPGARVLEVGTGSGYQAAVLAELGARCTTIEIVRACEGRATLERLGTADPRGQGWLSRLAGGRALHGDRRVTPPLRCPGSPRATRPGRALVIPVGRRIRSCRSTKRTAGGIRIQRGDTRALRSHDGDGRWPRHRTPFPTS